MRYLKENEEIGKWIWGKHAKYRMEKKEMTCIKKRLRYRGQTEKIWICLIRIPEVAERVERGTIQRDNSWEFTRIDWTYEFTDLGNSTTQADKYKEILT